MMRWLSGLQLSLMTIVVSVCLIAAAGLVSAEELVGKGEWQSRSGGAMRGTWTATLERSGATIEGSMELTGSPLFNGGGVTGTIEGDHVVLGVLTEGEQRATFKGALTDRKIAGDWDCPSIGDQGGWSGTLESADQR